MAYEFNRHHGNIFSVYAAADRWDISQGMAAYQVYHTIMNELAAHYEQPFYKVCGVFAALSPNADYLTNLESTKRVLQAWRNVGGGEFITDPVLPVDLKVTTYGANKRKAWAILGSDKAPGYFFEGAPKTQAFFYNIVDPTRADYVTIDGHMLSVWDLKRYKMQGAGLSARKYAIIALDYKRVAQVLGILPNQLQAICWFTWKRLNLINTDIAALQIGLFQ